MNDPLLDGLKRFFGFDGGRLFRRFFRCCGCFFGCRPRVRGIVVFFFPDGLHPDDADRRLRVRGFVLFGGGEVFFGRVSHRRSPPFFVLELEEGLDRKDSPV